MKVRPAISILLTVSIILFMTGCGGGGGGAGDGFTVNYMVDGAESGSGPEDQFSSGDEVEIRGNTGNLTRGGYLFAGWNTRSDGTGKNYAPGVRYKGDDLVLYPKWAAIYLYEIVSGGSPVLALNAAQKAPGTSTLRLIGLTGEGHQQSVLDIPPAIDGYTVTEIGVSAFEICTNLQFVSVPETVTSIGDFAFNGCTGLTSLVLRGSTPPALGGGSLDGCPVTISVPLSAVDTYKAAGGWDFYSASIEGYINIDVPCTVTFDGQGATTPASPSSITVNPPALTVGTLPTAPKKTGYIFGGWYTEPAGAGTEFTASTPVAGDMTVYAKWDSYSYTVAFDDQGATTPVSPASKTVNSPATTVGSLPTAPEKTGQIFVGWYTQAGGGGTQFTASTPVTGDITVYAYWADYSYTVTFDDQGATTHVNPASKTVNSPATTVGSLPAPPEKTGFAFGGWYTQTGGAGDEFTAGTTVTGNITVYAKWNPVYTVTFNDQGATTPVSPATKTVTYPATTIDALPTAPQKSFCTFGGWYTQTDGAGDEFTAGTTVTGNITVYAKWTFTPVYTEKNNLAVGDIVLQNGKYVSYSNFTAAPDEYMALSPPAGVVAYFGETGTAGITGKIYMVGLRYTSAKWAKVSTKGYYTQFSTSETAGESNWAVIQTADPTGSANASTNYPAFDYANSYSVTGYTSGWFLPSKYELWMLYDNRVTINNSITTITDAGGTATSLTTGYIWSSSQNTTTPSDANSVNFGEGYGQSYIKSDSILVRVVRALD